MKILRQILLIAVITVGFSLTAMAQKQDDKKTPPKQDPPKIRVEDKKNDKPKDDKRDDRRNDRQKPEMSFAVGTKEAEIV